MSDDATASTSPTVAASAVDHQPQVARPAEQPLEVRHADAARCRAAGDLDVAVAAAEDVGHRLDATTSVSPAARLRRVPETYHQRQFALPPGATEVILVRHGASAPAVPGEPFPLLDGHGDPPLAPEGEAQAEAIAERLAREGLTRALRDHAVAHAPHRGAAGGAHRARAASSSPTCARSRSASGRAASSASAWPSATRSRSQAVTEERWDVIPGAETMESLARRVRAGITGDRRRARAPTCASRRSSTAA